MSKPLTRMEEIDDAVPERYKYAGNLEAFLSMYAKEHLNWQEGSYIDLTQADISEMIKLLWATAVYRGSVDAAVEVSTRLRRQHEAMSEELESLRSAMASTSTELEGARQLHQDCPARVAGLERELHDAATGLAHQRNQIQDLNREIGDTLNRLQDAHEQIEVLLGRSYLFKVTVWLAGLVERLQKKLRYR
jgi:septal ring factor EnvC (AmiA/AmiB activator)